MKRGSTPTHHFTLPFDGEVASRIEITYSQNGEVVLQKDEYDCKVSGNVISTTLSQEDTFLFDASMNVEIQIRVKDKSGTVLESEIMCIRCGRCLSEEVL